MTLTLSLTPELEEYLTYQAEQQGISIEAFILQFLTEQILKQEKQTSLVNLLDSWLEEEDALEQKETGEFLINALDEDRLSDRKLFPPAISRLENRHDMYISHLQEIIEAMGGKMVITAEFPDRQVKIKNLSDLGLDR